MVQARIHQGRVEAQDPIPAEWEGQLVTLVPQTPDDALPDLDARLAALHALGPMEWDPGEREAIAGALGELDRISKEAMQDLANRSS